MLEIFITPEYRQEALEWVARFRNFNTVQAFAPEEFEMVNGEKKIKMSNNPKYKKFELWAN